jgi:histone acetyltransferase (RNA polymerase elongator complex component)
VYGDLAKLRNDPTKNIGTSDIQHGGFGKQLMQLAEDISLHHDYTYISVIAGV